MDKKSQEMVPPRDVVGMFIDHRASNLSISPQTAMYYLRLIEAIDVSMESPYVILTYHSSELRKFITIVNNHSEEDTVVVVFLSEQGEIVLMDTMKPIFDAGYFYAINLIMFHERFSLEEHEVLSDMLLSDLIKELKNTHQAGESFLMNNK